MAATQYAPGLPCENLRSKAVLPTYVEMNAPAAGVRAGTWVREAVGSCDIDVSRRRLLR